MMNNSIDWLLTNEPWVEYRTRLDLIELSERENTITQAKKNILIHPKIQSIFDDLYKWQEQVINNHKNAELPLHKLSLIADIGITIDEPEVNKIVKLIMEHEDNNGVFQVSMNIPKHFGGTGQNNWGWMLCDAPIIFYSLLRFGVPRNLLLSGIKYLVALIKDNGWGCAVSPEMGKFRGPGRKSDPCPYATLMMLKLLSQMEEFKNGNECRVGAEALLKLWENSKEAHPYMFYMGTDFRKLKAPTIWYDIVSVTDVLSQFEWLRNDSRLIEMVEIIKSKADSNGCFIPESEYRAYKGWDFGQKKIPSQWLTFLILRIIKRMETT